MGGSQSQNSLILWKMCGLHYATLNTSSQSYSVEIQCKKYPIL